MVLLRSRLIIDTDYHFWRRESSLKVNFTAKNSNHYPTSPKTKLKTKLKTKRKTNPQTKLKTKAKKRLATTAH